MPKNIETGDGGSILIDLETIKPNRDRYNNPQWGIVLPVKMTRLDNSTYLSTKIGDLTSANGEAVGDVRMALGGLTVILTIRKGTQSGAPLELSLDLKDALTTVIDLCGDVQLAERIPLRKE